MLPDTITVSSRIDTKIFRNFAVFDTLIRQRRLRLPAQFFASFLVFAAICFAMQGKARQAVLLGAVMLGIAIILPAAYLGMFFLSVSQKARELNLETPRHVYTVSLTSAPDGITINSAIQSTGTLRVRWEQVHHAYRTNNCIYLYISPRQAFLLPDHQSNVSPNELWDFLGKYLSADKLTDRRK